MSAPEIPGLLLTGATGAGKTAVAIEAGEQMSTQGDPTAIVDLDWLCWLPGIPSPEIERLMLENLAAVWPRFRDRGARRLIVTRAVSRPNLVQAIRDETPDVRFTVVRIEASVDTIQERLMRRDTGSELEAHLAEAYEWIRLMGETELDPISVDNDGARSVREVAAELLRAVGWRPG